MANKPDNSSEITPVDQQAREQTGKQQVRLRVDERNLTTSYANAFRTNASADEIIVDFGLNMIIQAPQQTPEGDVAGDILFQASNRLVLNFFTAKRLAISLGQLIQRHEQQFGELKLNIADRAKGR